jgi:Flp pilus assembly pilin Flp
VFNQRIPVFGTNKLILARLRGGLRNSSVIRDRSGQDLIEYALLTALLGTIAVAAIPVIESAINTAYSMLNTGTQDLWQPPNPGAGS